VISFRYHLVSIVAVFLALAVGIVVGTTALNGPVTTDLRKQVNTLKGERADLAKQVKTLQNQVDNAGQFATTFGSQLVTGTLKDKSVLLIGLPGATTGTQDGIAAELTAAGATITGHLQLAHDYVDQSGASNLSSLVTGSLHPVGLTLPETSDARLLGAATLAYVLLGSGQPTDLKSVLSAFSASHLITSDPKGIEPAKMVVVVGTGTIAKDDYVGAAEVDLVNALQSKGGQVVVAGDTGSALGGGVVALVRSSAAKAAVSTVDNANSAFGQVSTTLALADAANSRVGHYGTAPGADALFPTPSG
jgi:hypothetical protein